MRMSEKLTERRLASMDRCAGLEALAERVSGEKYGSRHAQRILDRGDWVGLWPVVGRGGLYTGGIVGSEDGYANLADMAMVSVDDLRVFGLSEDGYCNLGDIIPGS